jgi:putative tryptophan/tyrosine transport system substrate-binding protein
MRRRVTRREFLQAVGGAAAAWPLTVEAQPTLRPTVGVLFPGASTGFRLGPDFLAGLSESGFIEGKTVAFEYRFAEGRYERLPALAADLVARKVDVIVADAAVGGLAAKAATSTIPVVFRTGSDPIQLGLVTSLNRPEGNVTGTTFLTAVSTTKAFQLLYELVPTAGTIGFLMNPDTPVAADEMRDARASAQALGIMLEIAEARSESDLETGFAKLAEARAGALVVDSDVYFFSQRDRIVALAARHRIPALYSLRPFALAGGFASYGGSVSEASREAGRYVGKILRGAKPADLPVVQSTKFELVINLKTAKALGLTIPPSVLVQADEVIE